MKNRTLIRRLSNRLPEPRPGFFEMLRWILEKTDKAGDLQAARHEPVGQFAKEAALRTYGK